MFFYHIVSYIFVLEECSQREYTSIIGVGYSTIFSNGDLLLISQLEITEQVTMWHTEARNRAMSGEADDTSDGIGKQNETVQGEQHSHLDAPNESLYMICGVLIAMLLVGLIIVLLAVTISKLRKRDENQHSNVRAADVVPDVVLQTTTTATPTATAQTTISTISQGLMHTPEQQPASGNGVYHPPQFLWQYPAQYTLYSNDQETLVHSLPAERPGFCRGFRKNLRGRWRRLVKRKPAQEVYTIPAELRDQLKQIYVY